MDSPADLQAALRATLGRQGIVVAENDPVLETAAIWNAAVADTLAAIARATTRIEAAQPLSTDTEAALVRRVEQAVRASLPGLGRRLAVRTTLMAALVLVTLLGAAGGGCFWLGRRTAAIEDAQLARLPHIGHRTRQHWPG